VYNYAVLLVKKLLTVYFRGEGWVNDLKYLARSRRPKKLRLQGKIHQFWEEHRSKRDPNSLKRR